MIHTYRKQAVMPAALVLLRHALQALGLSKPQS